MAGLILPNGFSFQPQYPAPLDPSSAIFSGLGFAVNAALGPYDSFAGKFASTWNGSKVVTPQGLGLSNTAAAAKTAEWGYNPILGSNGNGSGGVTFIALANPGAESRESCLIGVMMNGPPYKQIALYANLDGNAGSASSGMLSLEAYNNVNQGYGNAAGAIDGKFHVYVGVFIYGVGATVYVDGIDKTTASGIGPGGGTGDFSADASSRISVGSESYNTSTRAVNCQIPFAAGLNKAITASEARKITENIWAAWRAPARRLWAVIPGGINLVGANASQANTASTGTVTQTQVLFGANSAQANTASTAAITQIQVLAGANSVQSNLGSSGAITLPGAIALVGVNVTQANTCSVGAITNADIYLPPKNSDFVWLGFASGEC